MKRRFDAQFTLMDKQSLRQWRAYIEKPFADTDSNLNSLHALLRESSFEASKKWTIPEMKQKIYIADQVSGWFNFTSSFQSDGVDPLPDVKSFQKRKIMEREKQNSSMR